MPLIETKGAGSAQGFGEFAKTGVATYIEDVFSTWLYTGNGSTQTITNGIDLSTKGGMVWIKSRSNPTSNAVMNTNSGVYKLLVTNATTAEQDVTGNGLSAFNTNGFTLSQSSSGYFVNDNALTYASWTFRKQPKFFDVVTYTGTGSAQNIAHSLGSTPGCIIVKQTSGAANWAVYHQDIGNTKYLLLNGTGASVTSSLYWNNTSPTSTQFTVGTSGSTNLSGATYVAYLFASNAGGFGLTGTDNVISCGSYTGNGAAGGQLINLGYEAQWVMIKNASSAADWWMLDTMRGWVVNGDFGSDQALFANSSAAEQGQVAGQPDALGFRPIQDNVNQSGQTYIYIAIRRGPMKVPTSGTSVFNAFAGSDTSAITTNFPVDFFIENARVLNSANSAVGTRLLGGDVALVTSSTAATQTGFFSTTWYQNNTSYLPACFGTAVAYAYQRAPNFFDAVCYTGTGGNPQTVNHNLGVAPNMVIVKRRSSGATPNWTVGLSFTSTPYQDGLYLNATNSLIAGDNEINGATSTTISVRNTLSALNGTFVAYLFSTCAGVSKVGSYTGTGATQTIDCGFTGGARFVLIKRTDSTGSWYVWDTARGMVSGTDPSLLLNSTAAEVNANSIYTTTGGFQIVSTVSGINASGGTYLFLAIA